MNGTAVVCKYCQCGNVRKYGFYKGRQIYYCNGCKRKFTPNDSLFHMEIPADQVSSALNCFYEGSSIREIQRRLKLQYVNSPSCSTIYTWIQKYTNIAVLNTTDWHPSAVLAKNLHPKVGDEWILVETGINLPRQMLWIWDLIDNDTQYLLISKVVEPRTGNECCRLMQQAIQLARKTPKIIVTNKLNLHLKAIDLAFGGDTKHVQYNEATIRDITERFHNALMQRKQIMKRFKGLDIYRAIQYTNGWLVYYNYLRQQDILNGKTPAEEAKVDYTFKHWADIIRMRQYGFRPWEDMLNLDTIRSDSLK